MIFPNKKSGATRKGTPECYHNTSIANPKKMSRGDKFQQISKNLRKFPVFLLLAVLVLGFVPLPTKAAPALNFDVNPKTVPSAGEQKLTFTATLTEANTLSCQASADKLYLIVNRSTTRDAKVPELRDGFGRTLVELIPPNTSTFSLSGSQSVKSIIFYDYNPVVLFKAFVTCVNGDPKSVLGGLLRGSQLESRPVTARIGNATGGQLIDRSKLRGSWTSASSVYTVNDKANSVTLNLSDVAVRISDKTPREFLEKNDIVIDPADTKANPVVQKFQLGVDRYGRNPKDWKCDGWLSSTCDLPVKFLLASNPANNPASGKFTIQFISPTDTGTPDKITPNEFKVSDEDRKNGFGITMVNLVVLSEGQYDLPYVSNKQITIKFDPSVPAGQQIGNNTQTAATGTTQANVESKGGTDYVTGTIMKVVNIILGFIIAFVRWIIWILGTLIFVPLLDTTLNMDASNITGVIVTGWEFVRDVTNMFFILALIVIGFGTMLRLESYNYKKLLVNLIVMALLVNFSLLIGRMIIQVADAVQFSFLPKEVDVIGKDGVASGISGVKFLFQSLTTKIGTEISANFQSLSFSAGTELSITGTMIFQLILDLAVILTFGALAIFMLIRTVALWILLILSPVAYALNILPATSGFAKQWWTSFIKYAFFAPIIAFFMRLSLELYRNGLRIIPPGTSFAGQAEIGNQNLNQYLAQISSSSGAISMEGFLRLIMIYFIILAFLWAGLIVTKKMGIAGADAIVGLAEKGLKAPFAYGWKGISEGAKGLTGLVGRTYSGFMARKAFSALEKERKAEQGLEAAKAKQTQLLSTARDKKTQAKKLRDQALSYSNLAKSLFAKGNVTEGKEKQKMAMEAQKRAKEVEAEISKLAPELAQMPHTIEQLEAEERSAKRQKTAYSLAQFLNPAAVAKGWHARKEELDRRAYLPAEGYVHDMLNKFLPTEYGVWHGRGWALGRETEHGFMGKFKILKEENKALEGIKINRAYAAYIKNHIGKTGTYEDIMGMETLIARNNNQDDFHNIYGGSKELPYSYSPVIDLDYSAKNYWNRLTKEEKELLTSTLTEEQEGQGRWRSYFYDERNETLVNDFSVYKDQRFLNEEKNKLVSKLRSIDPKGLANLANRVANVQSVSDIEGDREVREAFISHRSNEVFSGKQRRGPSGGWAKGIEAAAVRRQGPDGWKEYSLLGLMNLKTAPVTVLQAYIGRIHEGQPRALVAGGAMVNSITKEIEIPDKVKSPVEYQAWQDIVRIRPELAGAVYTYFKSPQEVATNFSKIVKGDYIMKEDGIFAVKDDEKNKIKAGDRIA